MALVPINNLNEKLYLFLTAKKLDGLSPITLIDYKRQIMKFTSVMQKDIECITAMDIRMYLAMRAKSGLKNSSMASIISVLKSFFSWLQCNDCIAKNPMLQIKTTKVDKYVRKALSLEELEMLRDACINPREKAMVEVFYSTASRLDEIQKLNKDDIDWSTGKVLVFGKGRKERPVYLNAKAKVYLWKYLNSRNDTNEALFVSERQPHKRLGRRSIETTFSRLGLRAGITKAVYPHLVRHTTATNMLNNGASLAEVQRYLGHTSPATTQIYAQLDADAIQQSHKKHVI
jgi:integrase/recombinase XerD